MTVCRKSERRTRASLGADQGVLGGGAVPVGAGVDGQVEGVEADTFGAEPDAGAADRCDQAGVLVFGVDDVVLDTPVQRAQ